MNSKIIFFVVVCGFLTVQASNIFKGTRKNLCVEKYDIETRKEAFKCGLNAALKNEDQDFANIFKSCENKYLLSEDANNGFPKICTEESKNGGPMSACVLRIMNPAKVAPSTVIKFRKEIDESCFKVFDAVEDTALTH